ncbi:MAG: M28 family peptidase [Vicinamibacterales bacterium]
MEIKALPSVVSIAALALAATAVVSAQSEGSRIAPWLSPYRDATNRLIGAAFADRAAWDRLAEMTDTFGPRLSGSPGLEAALKWAAERMRADQFDAVTLEPVKVPKWVRGRESLSIVSPFPRPLTMLGLGGSVGTPENGVEAEVLVIASFAELDRRAADVKGRIVLFNAPFVSYGETVAYRMNGPSRAAQHGAVAALVRSVGPTGLRTPHTGALAYLDDLPKIPAASIATEDADALARFQSRGQKVLLRLTMEAHTEADADSANLVADLKGREKPDEIVVVACHIDSWDVGTGANDDGVGCIVVWEAARLLNALNLRPRRTVRVVLYVNEENGLRGGVAYRDAHRNELDRHVLMIETDSGVYPPLGLGVSGNETARQRVRDIVRLLEGIGITRVDGQGGGADIAPSVQAAAIPAASLNGDPGRYFQIHHTHADTVERLEPSEVSRAVAGMAVLTYLAAELPERFGER